MAKPLRSTTITAASTLLRTCPPLFSISILLALQVRCLCRSLCTAKQVPSVQRKSPEQDHATSMPDAVQPVNRFPLNLSQGNITSLVLTSFYSLSTLERWFTCVRLLAPYLTYHYAFSVTLTTLAFDQHRSQWFVANSCKPTTEDLPPSLTPLAAAH
jgi:hypothetical protein